MKGHMTLPNFLIIGAPKAGTTGLYYTLRQHPQIFLSDPKEPFYFLPPEKQHDIKNMADYLALFSNIPDGKVAIGEASVHYLGNPASPKMIYNALPKARLIAILRQPADRTYSHYLMYRREGKEDISDFSTIIQSLENPDISIKRKMDYLEDSLYSVSLKRYLSLFPREQMLIFLYEDWKTRPDEVLQKIMAFLGVDASINLMVKNENVTMKPRLPGLFNFLNSPQTIKNLLKKVIPYRWGKEVINRINQVLLFKSPPLNPTDRHRLTKVFRSDIIELQDLIGRDLSSWLR